MNLDRNVYILDGGLATEIESKGIDLSNDPLWSTRLLVTNPQVIYDIHKCYLQHGADIIITNSYQASIELFTKHLNMSPCEGLDLIGRSASLAKEARDWFVKQPESKGRLYPLIAGSVGPYGACLHDGSEYTGNYIDIYPPEVIKEWHRPRMAKLIESGIDVLAIEIIPTLKEAEIIIDLLKEYPKVPNTNAWVSFSCKDHLHTCYGEVFADAVKTISRSSPQVRAVGINCSFPQYIEELLVSAIECTNTPFVVYPNSSESWTPKQKWHGEKVDIMKSSKNWVELGAKIIGGCCRITPQDITNIRQYLSEHNKLTQN